MPSNFDDPFVDLAKQLVESPGGESMNALWYSVYALDEWFWIARKGKESKPAWSKLDGVSTAVLFTSRERAEAVIASSGLDAIVCSARVSDAIVMLDALLAHGVVRVAFNPNRGEQAFFAPMDNLPLMADRFFDPIAYGLWAPFARAVKNLDQPAGWAALNKRVVSLPCWLLPEPLDSVTHVVDAGKTLAIVFTDELAARDWDGDCQAVVPQSVVNTLPQVAAANGLTIDGYRFNSRTEAFDIERDDLERFVAFA